MKKSTLFALLGLQFLIVFEMSMVMPMAPIIAATYQVNPGLISLLNIGFTAAGFLAPYFGMRADKHSIKKTIILVFISFIFGCFGIAFIKHVIAFFIFRFFIGIGYYTLISLTISYAAALIDHAQIHRFSGANKIAFALGVISAPLLCNQIALVLGFQWIYGFLGLASLLILAIMLTIPDIAPTSTTELSLHSLATIAKRTDIKQLLAFTILASTPSVFVYGYTSIAYASQGIDFTTISWFYTIIALGSLSAGFLLLLIGKRFKMEHIILFGCLLVISTLMFLTRYARIAYLFGFAFGLGYDLLWGCLYPYSAKHNPTDSGAVLTLMSLAMAFSNSLQSLIGPLIYTQLGYRYGLALTLLCFVGAVILFKQKIMRKPQL